MTRWLFGRVYRHLFRKGVSGVSKATLLVSTAVGLTLTVAPALALGHKHAPAGVKGQSHAPNAHFKYKNNQSHASKIGKAVLTWSTSTTYGFGFFLDPSANATVKCKAACTIVTESVAELLTYYSYEQTGICPIIDSYFTNGSCYFSGTSSFQMLYHNITNDTNISVGSGSHSVEVYLYSGGPAYWSHRQNLYTVLQ